MQLESALGSGLKALWALGSGLSYGSVPTTIQITELLP